MQVAIFESEYNFCKILWENEPIKSAELVKLCKEKLEWKKSTTYTVIKRLSERGVIKSENAIITSIIKKEDAQTMECIKTIDTRFDGSLPNFISAFIRARDISEEDKKRIMKEFDVKE
jgi:BlaI family penicillinase repressor